MEPAVLLKHVAVQSQLCLPATQHVIAAQNKQRLTGLNYMYSMCFHYMLPAPYLLIYKG